MPRIYLSLGSNLGDRQRNLRDAIDRFDNAGIRVTQISPIYETEPVDVTDQPSFLNLVLEADTNLSPHDLLARTSGIEKELGRVRSTPKGPRTIDVDILFYENEIIDTPELQVPHPRMAERRFVLVPLAAIAPQFTHPILNQTMEVMREAAPRQKVVQL